MGGPHWLSVDSASLRRQAEQAMESKPVSRVSPWPLLQFLSPGFCLDFPTGWTLSCNVTGALSPSVAFGHGAYEGGKSLNQDTSCV